MIIHQPEKHEEAEIIPLSSSSGFSIQGYLPTRPRHTPRGKFDQLCLASFEWPGRL
jgi:hypothetical protein